MFMIKLQFAVVLGHFGDPKVLNHFGDQDVRWRFGCQQKPIDQLLNAWFLQHNKQKHDFHGHDGRFFFL